VLEQRVELALLDLVEPSDGGRPSIAERAE
jgi:hypothetical protein